MNSNLRKNGPSSPTNETFWPQLATSGEVQMARRYEAIVGLLGGQAKRDGLLATPVQAGRSMRWATKGYRQDPLAIMESAVSDEARSEMILVKRIELYSTCEHHRLPFFGKAHVASIPDGKIVGLSKIPRVVEVSCASLAGAGAAYGADRGRTCGEEVTTMTGKAVFSSNIFEFVLCVALVFIPLREARKF